MVLAVAVMELKMLASCCSRLRLYSSIWSSLDLIWQ